MARRYADLLEHGQPVGAAACALLLGIGPREFAAHCRGVRDWDDADPGFAFDHYSAAAPGRFDPRVFDQNQVWVDVLRRPHRITDRRALPDGHLLNVIGFLREEAWRWFETDEPVRDAHVFRQQVDAWLSATPLMNALMTEAARRGLNP